MPGCLGTLWLGILPSSEPKNAFVEGRNSFICAIMILLRIVLFWMFLIMG